MRCGRDFAAAAPYLAEVHVVGWRVLMRLATEAINGVRPGTASQRVEGSGVRATSDWARMLKPAGRA